MEFTEFGNEILPTPIIGGRIGLSVSQDLNNYSRIELGFTYKNYKDGFGFRILSGYAINSAVSALCFPLRLHTKINLYKNKLFLSPVVGVTYGRIPTSFSNGGSYVKISSGTDSLTFLSYSGYGINPNFFLIQAGLSIDIIFKNNSFLSVFSSYYSGQSKIYRTNFTYQRNNLPWINGQAFSKGSFWDIIGISFNYPINKLRQKKATETTTN